MDHNASMEQIDYENQLFDELNVNLYETVIAVSKLARRINDKAQKYLGPEISIKPITIALNKLKHDEIDFTYDTGRTVAAPGESAVNPETDGEKS